MYFHWRRRYASGLLLHICLLLTAVSPPVDDDVKPNLAELKASLGGKPEPTSFLDLLREREADESTPVIADFVPVHSEPPIVSDGPDEGACVTPHMCSFCWINDHMYCLNMKRNEHDVKPYGECLHFRYEPCAIILLVYCINAHLLVTCRAIEGFIMEMCVHVHVYA